MKFFWTSGAKQNQEPVFISAPARGAAGSAARIQTEPNRSRAARSTELTSSMWARFFSPDGFIWCFTEPEPGGEPGHLFYLFLFGPEGSGSNLNPDRFWFSRCVFLRTLRAEDPDPDPDPDSDPPAHLLGVGRVPVDGLQDERPNPVQSEEDNQNSNIIISPQRHGEPARVPDPPQNRVSPLRNQTEPNQNQCPEYILIQRIRTEPQAPISTSPEETPGFTQTRSDPLSFQNQNPTIDPSEIQNQNQIFRFQLQGR